MATIIKMKCDGDNCHAEAATERVYKKFRNASGRSNDFGSFVAPSIDDAVEPTGWVWCDPYTSCTYCPACKDRAQILRLKKTP